MLSRIALLSAVVALYAQIPVPPPLRTPVADKNFYLLTRMEGDPRVAAALLADAGLRELSATKRTALAKAASSCALTIECHLEALQFSEGEIESAAGRLAGLARAPGPVKSLVAGPLRDSGMFIRYHDRTDETLLATAWRDAAHGLNNVIAIYAAGKPPRYAAIDSAMYDTKAESYRRVVDSLTGALDDRLERNVLFFIPALRFAMDLMTVNNRDEAGRHEPMEAGENRAAYMAVPGVRWSDYPYTAIVVPGAGGDRPTVRLSAFGRLRIGLAAERWRAHKAPFIIVSGGYVHPNQTPFAEAIEMKRALIADFGVPEAAIIVDPHARHTTTNMRNAARLLFRYGIPFDRAALVTSDAGQSTYIEGPGFADRCRKELGYLPYRLGKRLSRYDQEFWPLIESLQADAVEPLDP